MMAPFALADIFGQTGFFIIVLLIGVGFGATLEMSGFGDSRILAAQFYFRDLTVLKVMFTAIITAMTLIFLMSSLGLLDYDLLYVNTTYLLPGIVGGLVMGVGFVIGGFCPGTSLVAMASLKLDGLLFVLGVLFGIFVFGDTIDSTFGTFWHSSNLGRFTLQDWLGVDAGIVVLLVILMALAMFLGGEKLEAIYGKKPGSSTQGRRFKFSAAGVLVLAGMVVALMGQPTVEQRWSRLPEAVRAKLSDRLVFIEPIEMLHVMKGRDAKPVLFDIRSEGRYNLFHILDSRQINPRAFQDEALIRDLKTAQNTIYFIVADDERSAAETWKTLTAWKVPNVYILNGGIDGWIAYFTAHPVKHYPDGKPPGLLPEDPDFYHYKNVAFTPKVKLQKVKAPAGGCG
ncbi:MAG: YeeE/YedE thiosulfate transporter family protein [bacterium]